MKIQIQYIGYFIFCIFMEGKSKTTIIILVLLFLLGCFIGTSIYLFFNKPDPIEIPIEVVPDNTEELAKIDSLNVIISEKNKEIVRLKKEIARKKEVVISEIEEIKQLPIDENVQLLYDNLVKYGELTKPDDSLAKIVNITGKDLQLDSAIVITEDNMKDVNIISAKYEGEVEINELLYEEIQLDSVIISKKDSIIAQSDIIIKKNEAAYNINIESIQKSLEQEKKNKKKLGWILGGTSVISVALSGLLLGTLITK